MHTAGYRTTTNRRCGAGRGGHRGVPVGELGFTALPGVLGGPSKQPENYDETHTDHRYQQRVLGEGLPSPVQH